jgi:hypothetical protein
VHSKLFLSLWYIWRKLCTYLASRLVLSPVEPHHQGVTSGSSKMISKPLVRFAQTVLLSYIQKDRNGIPHDPPHVGVPSGVSKTISEPMVCLAHTRHISCVKISTISKRNEMSF